jgi:hypothetical protein
MKTMPEPRMHGMYGRIALKAMQDALYERDLDLCRKEMKDVLNRPEVLAAEELILRALAQRFAEQADAILAGRKAAGPDVASRPR